MSDSSLSVDMYPDEPDSAVSPASKAVGAKGTSTPKGASAPKAKGTENFQGNISDSSGGPSQLDSVIVGKDVDAFVSVQKYIVPALKGFSPKNQAEVDEALIQQCDLEGICVSVSCLCLCSWHISSLFDIWGSCIP